jgi:hypothetical protein
VSAAALLSQVLLPLTAATAWVVTVAWVRDDARRRIRNRRAVLAATLATAVVPVAAAAVWALLRPAETLEERRCRRLARLLSMLEAGPEGDDFVAAAR